jgi:hypothetical protein
MRQLLLAAMILGTAALADEPKPKPKGPKVDLGLPTFNAIPSGGNLEKPKDKPAQAEPTSTATNTTYTVVRLAHGKGFIRAPEGAKPSAPFEAVTATGSPLMTEKYSAVVRVKCPNKINAAIELAVVDERGDTVMEASGELFFRGSKQDEIDYQVDWDPTGLRRVGDYQVLVRVAGQPMGTWPLKVVEKK